MTCPANRCRSCRVSQGSRGNPAGHVPEVATHGLDLFARKGVEQRHVRLDVVALGREVLGPQPVEPRLGGLLQQEGDDQRLHRQTIARTPLPSTVTPPALTS